MVTGGSAAARMAMSRGGHQEHSTLSSRVLGVSTTIVVLFFVAMMAVPLTYATTEQELIDAIQTPCPLPRILVINTDIILSADLPPFVCQDLTLVGRCTQGYCQIDGQDEFAAFRNPWKLAIRRKITITGMRSNRADGAPVIYRDSSARANIVISDCRISYNTNEQSSGVISLHWSTITVDKSTMVGNTAVSGGALWLRSVTKLMARHADFFLNSAVVSGGAIGCVSGSSIQCAKCRFRSNRGGEKGGAVFLDDRRTNARFESSVFIANSLSEANSKGGAVYIGHVNNKVHFCHCTFSSNKAFNSPQNVWIGMTLPIPDSNGLVTFCPAPLPPAVYIDPSFAPNVFIGFENGYCP